MKKSLLLTIGAVSLIYTGASAWATNTWFAQLTNIGTSGYPFLASSGDFVVGSNITTHQPYIWSPTSGYQTLISAITFNGLTGGNGTIAAASDNNAMVGTVNFTGGSPTYYGLYWSSPTATPIVVTSSLGTARSSAAGISANGAYVTGQYDTNPYIYKVSNGAIVKLNLSGGATSGSAIGITNDGKVALGEVRISSTDYATYWYSANGFSTTASDYTMYYLSPTIASNTSTAATSNLYVYAISSDGSTIVGDYETSTFMPYKWVRSATTPSIYTPTALSTTYNGQVYTEGNAMAVNSDGSVIVGAISYNSSTLGVIWNADGTLKTIAQWLADSGVTVNLGSTTIMVGTGVSSDGSVILGLLSDSSVYVARGTGSSSGSGLITLNDLAQSLTNNSVVPAAVSLTGDLVMHGAHGHPLLHLAPEGKYTAWMSGDFGFSSNSDVNAFTDVAEIGVGNRLSKYVQVNLSVGKIWAGQKTVFNGDYKQDMTYILPEVIANIPETPIWSTLSVQYASGPLDANRGYINAGNQDYSFGSTQADIYAFRSRFDWKDAAKLEEVTITPYVDHQHTVIAISSYTENGGGFPARWNGRHENDDITRIGIDMERPITPKTKILATVEQNHWWQGKGASTSGSVIGLSSFDLPGVKYTKDTTHVSLGVAHDLDEGQISIIGNASTSGQNPQYWLGVGYQYTF